MSIQVQGITVIDDSKNGILSGLTVVADANIGGLTVGKGSGSSSAWSVAVGANALQNNTTGNWNSAIGAGALFNNTIGEDNSAVGINALLSNTEGVRNSAVGSNTLYSNTTGYDNSVIGSRALHDNTTGFFNSVVGYQTLCGNTTGSMNVAIGGESLVYNTTGSNHTAVGAGALYSSVGDGNTALGSNSGWEITTGSNNVVIGGYTGFATPISETGSNFVVLSDGSGTVRQTHNASGALAFDTAGSSFGTSGQVLQSNGSAAVPTWETPIGGGGGAVDSVAGQTGVVTLTPSDVGLSNVTNDAQLTSVTGTSPIISSGGLTPAISISAATDVDAGSMSSADKSKLDAITGTNTGDETSTTIKTALGITTLSGSNTGDQILPTTLPASDVYTWAKAATKPTYTYTEVGAQVAGTYATGSGSASGTNTGDQTTISGNAGTATILATARNINGVSFDGSANITINAIDSTARIASSLIGSASGVCPLDASSKITATYLPSYVDDVLEYTDLAGFPATGETGKIYVDLATNKTYRWSGSAYIYITSGAVDSVAGRMGVVTLTSSDVGLSSVTNNAQVTSVSGTAPIVSSGGLTPAISISAATTSVAGSMSSADKTKLDAIAGSNTGDQIIPTTLPASDVSAWAKEATKPTYTYTEVGAQVAGNYASGTGSASGTNTGDETSTSIKTALGITTLSGSNTGDQIIPTTLPASDVSAWAKESTKPIYTYTEVGAQVAGTYATGTGSASGTNTGDETTATIKTALGITTLSGSNTGDQTTISGNAGTATSIAGQTTNGILYQSGSGVTASTLASTAIGQVLTTTTLGGVPTWETPSASGGVAGTTGQVQYNSAGAMAGASYVNISGGHLNVADAGTIPTTPPAGTLTYFAEDHAGRMLPSVIGPSGVDFNLQSALYGNTNYMWLAGTAAVGAISWGTTFTPVQAGTAAAQSNSAAKTSTSAMTSMNRANYGTGSTATGSAGVFSASTVSWLGNAAGLGGFLFFARFGVETASVNTYRVFVGLSGTGVVLAGEPSALINSIALVKDAADTTWFISTRGATTSAKTNTGIAVTVGQVLDVYIHTAPNTSSVKVEIKNSVTGATLYVTPTAITATLPANTMFMYMQAHIMSSAGTTAKLLGLNRMYLETDL